MRLLRASLATTMWRQPRGGGRDDDRAQRVSDEDSSTRSPRRLLKLLKPQRRGGDDSRRRGVCVPATRRTRTILRHLARSNRGALIVFDCRSPLTMLHAVFVQVEDPPQEDQSSVGLGMCRVALKVLSFSLCCCVVGLVMVSVFFSPRLRLSNGC